MLLAQEVLRERLVVHVVEGHAPLAGHVDERRVPCGSDSIPAWRDRMLGRRLGQSSMAARPLLGRLGGPTEVVRSTKQRDVRKRLRKVADLSLRARIVLLSQKPDIIA